MLKQFADCNGAAAAGLVEKSLLVASHAAHADQKVAPTRLKPLREFYLRRESTRLSK
jgi:hypothetical protein